MEITVLRQTEVAELLGISPRTLERWRRIGQGPQFLKIGKRVGYNLEDVRAYIERVTRSSTSES